MVYSPYYMGSAGFIASAVFSFVGPVWILFYEELSDATKGQPRKPTAEGFRVQSLGLNPIP